MSKTFPQLFLKQYLNLIKSGKSFESVMKNVTITTASDGHCKAEFTVQPEHTNAFGYLHGGFSATLVDIVSNIALLCHKRKGGGVSVNINLSYLKGAQVGEPIIVEAKTNKAGKKLGFLEVEIKNKDTGDILVRGTHTKYMG